MPRPAAAVPEVMRAPLLVLTLAAGHAGADPKTLPNSAIPEGTPPVQQKLPDVAKTTPGVGGPVRGIIIDPGEHADARPWPRGMVIHPPDTRDPMVLDLGGDPHLGQRILGVINDGFDMLGRLLRPPI